MVDYCLEAKRETQRGTVILGARIGYSGADAHDAERVCKALDVINAEFIEEKKRTLGCIVGEGVLVGRTGDTGYRERVYRCEFATSPRAEPMNESTFHELLVQYAHRLGARLKQERVYLEYNDMTDVYRAGKQQV